MSNLKKLLKGQGMVLRDDDIVDACHHFPNMSTANYAKLEKAYNKNKGCRLKLTEPELIGHGLNFGKVAKKVGKVARKVGKIAMKSGVGDMVIDEAVGALPIPVVAQKAVAKVVKQEARQLTGTGANNPYIPHFLKGSGLQQYGIPVRPINNSSNEVSTSSDAFHPSVYNSQPYANPLGYELLKDKRGRR
jgi:hypothetical protein